MIHFSFGCSTLFLLVSIPHFDFGGYVLCVHVVQDVLERRDIHAARVVDGINAIIDCDKPHIPLREVNLRVLAAENVVAPQAGEVLHNDKVDFAFFNVRNHFLEAGPLKISPRVSIVRIYGPDLPALAFYIIGEHIVLVADAHTLVIDSIFGGQPTIDTSRVFLLFSQFLTLLSGETTVKR